MFPGGSRGGTSARHPGTGVRVPPRRALTPGVRAVRRRPLGRLRLGDHSRFASRNGTGKRLLVFPPRRLRQETLYAVARDGTVYAFDRDDGTTQWAVGSEFAVSTSPAVTAERLYTVIDRNEFAVRALERQ